MHGNETLITEFLSRWHERWEHEHTVGEAAWIHHQITQCYLGMNKPKEAAVSAEMAHKYSLNAGDPFWQVNTDLLLAQAQGGLAFWLEQRNNQQQLQRCNIYPILYLDKFQEFFTQEQ